MEVFLLFMLYSFFGCVLEEGYHFLLNGRYMSKRMLLNLPLCPVYGIAALVLAAVNRTANPILLFFNGFFAISAVELAYYLISQRIYGIKWWDYSELKLNSMGGISLFYSVMWGVLNILFALWIHPFFWGWIKDLPREAGLVTGLFAAVYFLADLRDTHEELMKHKRGEKNLIDKRFLYIKPNN